MTCTHHDSVVRSSFTALRISEFRRLVPHPPPTADPLTDPRLSLSGTHTARSLFCPVRLRLLPVFSRPGSGSLPPSVADRPAVGRDRGLSIRHLPKGILVASEF